MHEAGALTWRDVVEKHHAGMLDELSACLDSDLKDAVSRALALERSRTSDQIVRAREEASRVQAESLNQALRRMRQATGDQQILRALVENVTPYATLAVVLLFENSQARVAASSGFEAGDSLFDDFAFDIADAPAVVAAIESGDPVTTLATSSELSAGVADKLATEADGGCDEEGDAKAYLFPVRSRQSVVALLLVSGLLPSGRLASGMTAPSAAPIELLCEAAGMRLESFGRTAQPQVSAPAESVPDRAEHPLALEQRLSWDALSPEDQRLHLQAQRMARLRVAEMRLYHEADLRRGVADGNVYGALQTAIDSARGEFLQNFLAKSPTMVDYLHLEVLRSLAHDNDALLGQSYPGPMV